MESRLRRAWRGRSRLAGSRALLWRLLGICLVLLWVNYAWVIGAVLGLLPVLGEPLGAFVGTLGYSAGGPVLAVLGGLVPFVWAWRRAAPHAAEARRYGAAARALGSRRFASLELGFQRAPGGDRFVAEATPVLKELRRLAPELSERGAIAAGDLARGCRTAYQLARRLEWEGAVDPLYALYGRFDVLERRLAGLEAKAADGLLASRRAQRESAAAQRAAAARLAPYVIPVVPTAAPAGSTQRRAPGPRATPVPSYSGRRILAGVAGVVLLAATVWLTGLYYVSDGTAVIIDPPEARLARLASAAGGGGLWSGLPLLGAVQPQDLPVETDDTPGFRWALPRPLTGRHAVSLEPQLLPVQAAFRRVGPDSVEVVQAILVFRISDVDRWAQRDREGLGTVQLSQELSGLLQTVIQSQRRSLRLQLAQQDPQLATDEAEAVRRADALLAQRMEEVVGAFVQSIGRSELAREAGVQFSGDFRMQLARQTGSMPLAE